MMKTMNRAGLMILALLLALSLGITALAEGTEGPAGSARGSVVSGEPAMGDP